MIIFILSFSFRRVWGNTFRKGTQTGRFLALATSPNHPPHILRLIRGGKGPVEEVGGQGRVENGDYGLAIAYSSALIVVMVAAVLLIQLVVGQRRLGRRGYGEAMPVGAA